MDNTPSNSEKMKMFANEIKEFVESIIPDLEQVKDKNGIKSNEEVEEILINESYKYIESFKILKKVYTDKESINFLNNKLMLYHLICVILENKGFSKGIAHYHSFTLLKFFIEEDVKDVNSNIVVSDLALIDDNTIEQMKLKTKLTTNLLKISTNLDLKTEKCDKYIESIELAKQISNLNIQISKNTHDAKSAEIETSSNLTKIVSKLTAINENLLETINIFKSYLEDGTLPPYSFSRLKELKQMVEYESLCEIISPIKHDKQLTNNIVNAIFIDLWKLTVDFLDIGNLSKNDKKFNEYRVKIIQIGVEVDFYLDKIDCLRYNLNSLHMFFTAFAIPYTGKWSIDNYGINLDFNDLLLESLNETDLIKKKDFILKKLHNAELFKLQKSIDKEYYHEFDDFIDKCYKAVDSIDFQLKNTSTAESPKKKPRTILDEKREIQEICNSPEHIAAMEESRQNMFRKLTDKDIELVTNDCNTLNEVYGKGLDIFESYFSTNQINTEDIVYLQTLPFSGLLSDNYFEVSVLSNFDDAVIIGTIFDICFADTIDRIQNLDFTFSTTPELNNEPRLKELIRIILKNNNNSVLIKDNLLSFAKQIRELIELVYAYTKNDTYIKNVNLNVYKSDSFFTELETNSAAVELPDNYINNGGIITTGNYDIEEYFRHFNAKNSKKELYIVDKLEISLAHYASNYKQNCENYWENYKFDPNYFNEFIPGELLSEFNLQLHDYIKPLNNHEINRYLTASIQQFKTHTPEKRKDAFFEIYHDVYWYPNYLKYTGSTSRENYVVHVWNLYSNHYNLFQEATQSAYDIFKASLTIGSVPAVIEAKKCISDHSCPNF